MNSTSLLRTLIITFFTLLWVRNFLSTISMNDMFSLYFPYLKSFSNQHFGQILLFVRKVCTDNFLLMTLIKMPSFPMGKMRKFNLISVVILATLPHRYEQHTHPHIHTHTAHCTYKLLSARKMRAAATTIPLQIDKRWLSIAN